MKGTEEVGLQKTVRDGTDVTGAAERSRFEQRWLEKLDRWPLTAVYNGQAVMTSTLIV